MSRVALASPIALAAVALSCAACATALPSTSASTLAAATVAAPMADAPTAAPSAYCREYRSTAEISATPREVVGTACRQPDGSWQIVDAPPAAAQPLAPTTVTNTTTYIVPSYPGYYGPWWPFYGPSFAFSSAFVFGGHHHHHRCWRCR